MSRRTNLWNEFRQAIMDADLVELRALLADPQLPSLHEDWATNQGQSLFGLALSSGSAEMVSAIVEADRSGDFWDPVNSRSESFDGKTRITPLAVALQANNESVVTWLVNQGADVNAACRWPDSAEGEVEIAEFFGDFEYGVCKGVCWWLASEEVLELMIGKGLDPDAADDDERTMLMLAIASSDATKVEELLRLGANPDQRLPYRMAEEANVSRDITALVFAVRKRIDLNGDKQVGEQARLANQTFRIVELLVRAGASYSPCHDDLIDGTNSGTVMDLVLIEGDDELLELFGLQVLREKLALEKEESSAARDSLVAIAMSRLVLPVYESAFPDDPVPRRALDDRRCTDELRVVVERLQVTAHEFERPSEDWEEKLLRCCDAAEAVLLSLDPSPDLEAVQSWVTAALHGRDQHFFSNRLRIKGH